MADCLTTDGESTRIHACNFRVCPNNHTIMYVCGQVQLKVMHECSDSIMFLPLRKVLKHVLAFPVAHVHREESPR